MGYLTVQKAILIDSHWRQLSDHESFLILYLKAKYRIDVKGKGEGLTNRFSNDPIVYNVLLKKNLNKIKVKAN